MKQINRGAFRGVAWLAKAAQFSLGTLAMLALVLMIGVLTAVMLMATVLPVSAVRRKRDPRVRRDSGNASEISAPRKAVAS